MMNVTAENQAEAAILSRRAVRGFLPTPIDRETVEHLLNVAARAPSGTNMQPWRAIALAGHYLPKAPFEKLRETFVRSPFYVQAAILMALIVAIQYIAATGAAPFIYTNF